jgi:integrase
VSSVSDDRAAHDFGLESGVHIKAVADLLGHSSIAITGDVYGHTSDDTARAAVDGLAGRLGL